MVADMTSLKNRMIIFGINNTPMIASTFGGPAIAQLFYDNLSYRWAFGAWCIILLGVAFPVCCVMLYMQMQARKKGMLVKERSNRKWHQSVWHYLIEFDGVYTFVSYYNVVLPFLTLSFHSGRHYPHHSYFCPDPLAFQQLRIVSL